MHCSQCGSAVPEGARFCSTCAAPVGPGTGVYPSAAPYVGPTETSGKAVASLICGILFFFVPTAIAAIILGHLSLSNIRKAAGRLTGRGMAIAGLVLGYSGIAVIPFILIIAAIAIPNLLRARMVANEASAVACLRTIAVANVNYSSTYGNGFAPDLGALGGADHSADCNHAQLLDDVLASGLKSGYRFTYTPKFDGQPAISSSASAKGCTAAGGSGFAVVAEPLTPGTTGQHSFFLDDSGIIREDTGAATAASPPIQ